MQADRNKLIPKKVKIRRKIKGAKATFVIDGFEDERTGKTYYKGKDVMELEKSLKESENEESI